MDLDGFPLQKFNIVVDFIFADCVCSIVWFPYYFFVFLYFQNRNHETDH